MLMVNIMKKLFKLLPKEQFAGIELVEGMSLYGTGEHGETVQVEVKSFLMQMLQLIIITQWLEEL